MSESTDTPSPRLLLIDDDSGQLTQLKAAIEEKLADQSVTVAVWQPEAGDDLRTTLVEQLEPRPTLVVTDHDLTANGAAGLLGGGVISWCRAHAIPVGDYSNKLADELEEPDLFEFRFAAEPEAAAAQIANLFLGFQSLQALLAERPDGQPTGWSHTLAMALGREHSASAFSLYSSRAGATHGAAIERLEKQFGTDKARILLEVYVIGHLLHNGILRYPGPIMSEKVLCSYLAISDDNAQAAGELFAGARYDGPFGGLGHFYWQDTVDDRLLELAEATGTTEGDISDPACRRALASAYLEPGLHPCPHCDGDRGGFRCPYTDRTTCDLPQCSVPTTNWIPQGAYLCRVDRIYYERWSPLLGL